MLKRLGKDIAIYGGTDFLFRFTQLLAVPIYAHLLSLSDFGILSLLTVSSTLLGMVAALGQSNAVQRFYFDPDLGDEDRSILVSTGFVQLAVSGLLVTGVGLLVLAGLGSDWVTDLGLSRTLLLVTLALVLPEQLSQYLLDSVRLHFSPAKFFLIALVKNFGGVLLGLLFLIWFDLGVLGVVLGILVAAILAVPVGLVLLRDDLTSKIRKDVAFRILQYGYPFVLTGAAFWVFNSVGNWMLGTMTTMMEVGLFAIGMKFAVVMSFLITAFAQGWTPFAMRMYGEDPDYLAKWSRVFSGWFFVLAVAGLGLSLFAPELLRILTPPEYWPASRVLAVGAIGLVFYGTIQLTVLGISIAKRTMLINYAAWAAAAVSVILNLLLIPRLGAVGAALATLAAYLILTAQLLFWSQRLNPMSLEYGRLGYSAALVGLSLMAIPVAHSIQGDGIVIIVKALILLLAGLGGFAVGIVNWDLYRTWIRRSPAQIS